MIGINESKENNKDNVKLGVIGAPSDWLISCKVDYNLLKSKFNIELLDISTKELEDNYNLLIEKEIVIPSKLLDTKYSEEELLKAYKLYLAIKKIIAKYDLKGFTIRCFDLLSSLKTTSCLALALLNDEGIIGTCEGDIPALVSMYLVRFILNKPSFQANPSEINTNTNKIILAHCTLPLSITTSYKLTTHYESKIGIGIKGELIENKKIFIFRISSSLDKYVLIKGKIIENLNKDTLCRTQIRIKLDNKNDINYFLTNPLGNHHIVVYEDYKKLEEYLNNIIKY
ncbi:MAG: hypothetical protein MR550_05060 [Bacilli bacterium]|nr:hypothetical protein [Bacilli bacterium]